MNVLGIIAAKNEPASRFRIAQYEPWLSRTGDQLDVYCPLPLKDADPPKWATALSRTMSINKWRIWNTAKLTTRFRILLEQYKHDIIWQNRLLVNTYFTVENYYKKPFAFDIDDAIWLIDGERAVQKALSKAQAVIAGNAYLAEHAKKTNPNTFVIPTAIDTSQLFPDGKKKKLFTIGWIGTNHNFRYLQKIRTPILNFLKKNTETQFTVVSSHPPGFFPFDNERIVFKKWSPEKENTLINEFSVGIMPIDNDDWTRGKCSCKMLQYMACGLPVIVSPFGQNKIILSEKMVGLSATTEKEWEEAFNTLKNDTAMSTEMGANGFNLVEKNYSCKINTTRLLDIFKRIQ
jgi:glycosyltransferase involved in cell wall biosynthesis